MFRVIGPRGGGFPPGVPKKKSPGGGGPPRVPGTPFSGKGGGEKLFGGGEWGGLQPRGFWGKKNSPPAFFWGGKTRGPKKTLSREGGY
ncbi:hypothetical protein EBI_26530 [Enterocytozoon bieneusi H348]|nr:hypothetical protein EBI_26530 [Enterocytozoon bieneusi H348]|eukprot:XP_002652374.1 hypothetical protein EBI_26530 [Enterocytozoon bieneusi H348]